MCSSAAAAGAAAGPAAAAGSGTGGERADADEVLEWIAAASEVVEHEPPPPSLEARLSVSLDGGQHFTPTVPFTYFHLRLSGLSPQGGPAYGGTTVTVQGSGFMPLGGVLCSFGGAIVQGTVDDSWSVRCASPALALTTATAAGSAAAAAASGNASNGSSVELELDARDVRVTLNGDPLSALSNVSLPYYYMREPLELQQQLLEQPGAATSQPVISFLLPTSGPSVGGTAVTIVGGGFANLGTPYCRFTPLDNTLASADAAATTAEPVLAALLPYGAAALEPLEGIVCAAPPHPLPVADGLYHTEGVPLEISLNGEQYSTSGVRFTYMDPCLIIPAEVLELVNDTDPNSTYSAYQSVYALYTDPNSTHFGLCNTSAIHMHNVDGPYRMMPVEAPLALYGHPIDPEAHGFFFVYTVYDLYELGSAVDGPYPAFEYPYVNYDALT